MSRDLDRFAIKTTLYRPEGSLIRGSWLYHYDNLSICNYNDNFWKGGNS